MNNILRFIPTRFDPNNKVNIFFDNLKYINTSTIVIKNIYKTITTYEGDGFNVNYIDYLAPTKFSIIDFEFYKSNIFSEFVNSNYFHIKGLVNITDLSIYDEKNIKEGSINKNRFIIEGVKGSGKSVLINAAIYDGVICQDRDMEVISNDNYNNISIAEKSRLCYERIHRDNNEFLLIIKNIDQNELMRRISKRNMYNEKDLTTELFNNYAKLGEYINRYNELETYMKEKGLLDNKIDIINCTGLGKEVQQNILLKKMKSK